MFRSIRKQSGKSMESVLQRKKKATVGRICTKKGFKPGTKERRVTDESGESMELMEEVPANHRTR